MGVDIKDVLGCLFFVASCLKYRIIALLAGVWDTWLKMCPKSLQLASISIL